MRNPALLPSAKLLLASLVGQGSFSALGNRHGVMSQRGPGDSARIYTFLSVADGSSPLLSSLRDTKLEEAKGILLSDESLLGGFGEPIKELASIFWDEEFSTNTTSKSKIGIKLIYTLSTDSSFPHCPSSNITVNGDAAHLVPPTPPPWVREV
ncbi:uncharacterized protein BDV17DRAFT_296276 [Aspergillus undulatus]|uniref:uncharacterized protein n=1 Tax=Aspergillus undulatus TaxID=1810928 RepID=UPI003CCE3360